MNLIALIFSGALLLAAAVCCLCDFMLTGALSWSLVVLISIALGWAVIFPTLLRRRKGLWISLAALTLLILPYLWALSLLLAAFSELLAGDRRVRLFAAREPSCQAGVLSVQFRGMDCEDAAAHLAARGVAVRAGLHCAPLAHRTAGTLREGTVRFSFSPFNTLREVRDAAAAVKEILA